MRRRMRASYVVSSIISLHTSEYFASVGRRLDHVPSQLHPFRTSHLHVHLLSSDYTSHPGSIVGQAHLLQDVIDLLELGVDFKKRTLTYSLGSRSPLLAHLQQHSADSNEADPSPAKLRKIDGKATPA